MNKMSMLRYLRDLPSIAAIVVIDVQSDQLDVMDVFGNLLIDDRKVPTPAWAPFNLEDYDQMIECISALEEWMLIKKSGKSGNDMRFRFDLKVLRSSKMIS